MFDIFHFKRFKPILRNGIILALIASVLATGIVIAAAGDGDPEFYGGAILIHTRDGFAGNERNFVALQSDGKIILAGNGTCNPDCDIIVLRRNADGRQDLTFGVDGAQITDLGANENVYGLAIQSDDKIVVSGSSCNSTGAQCHLFLARYLSAGALDTSFHGNGVFILGGSDPESMGGNIAIRPNGKIIVLGTLVTDISYDSVVFQFNSDGSVDHTFGSVGGTGLLRSDKLSKRTGWRNGFAFLNLNGNDLRIQADGKIVIVGSISNQSYSFNFAVVRLLQNGDALDNSFGQGGMQVTDLVAGDDWASSVDIGSDGKIVLAGSAYMNESGKESFAVARYSSNGFLDTTFHGTGYVTTDVESGNSNSDGGGAWDVLVQRDGKILALGYKNPYGLHQDITLVRYNRDGSLDATFGTNGIVASSYYTENYGSSIAIQPDGKYVVTGLSLYITGWADYHYFTLSRILP